MAEVFRPSYTYTDPKTGKKRKGRSKTWHIRYYTPDGQRHRVKGYRDKKATEALATQLERRGIRLDAGLADPMEEHAKKPLDDHLAEYRGYLIAKENTSGHVTLTEARIRYCLDSCRFVRIADLQPSAVIGYLAELRNKGKSIATANYYLTAVKGFTRWLWKDRRIGTDPLAGLSKLANAATDIRHARRDFVPEEMHRLLDRTRQSERAFRGLSGMDRFALYATAVGTGFRASELASLTPAGFDLALTRPVVMVEAAYSKNRHEAVQPIAADLAELLRGYLADKPSGSLIWPGTWNKQASAKMLRLDLEEARQAWIAEATEARGRQERTQSDFLAYRDAAGRYADFHALRHTYVSRLVQSGASPKTAQTLARHSDVRMTLGRYAHAGLFDLTAAVDALPSVLPTEERAALAATGTDGKSDSPAEKAEKNLSPILGPQPAILGDFLRQAETETVDKPDSENPGNHADSCVISGVFDSEGDGTRTRNHRIDSPVSPEHKAKAAKGVTETNHKPLAQTLARETQTDPDLARVVHAWQSLPEAIRRAILALIEHVA